MDLPSRSSDPSNPSVTPDLPTERSRSSAGSPAERSRSPVATTPVSRYESQKRRDWNTFLQYLKTHKPPLMLSRCSGAHVIEFLKYLDQFGKTKVHATGCSFFGHPNPPAPCTCPLKQAWGSLDALIGRLRAAYEENGGRPESNPFGARAVRIYLREVKDSQAKARGVPYENKKRKRAGSSSARATAAAADTSVAVDDGGGGVTDDGGNGGVISGSEFTHVTSTEVLKS
ncbi:hypothetical protein R6Q57_003355 [Mikania cordata]